MTRLLPAIGDELLLAVPHTESVLARVCADGPGYFDLKLLERPGTPQPQLERSALMIEFINDEGVARLHGRLDVPAYRRGTGGFPAADTLRFAHRGSPQLLRRREYVRATVELALTISVDGADEEGVTADAQALDLSGGGMLIGGLEAPKVGQSLRFELTLDDDGGPIEGRCEVMRLEGVDRAGVRFVELTEDDRVRLSHRAFAMSREQRRRIA
jgi:c-di-GMP-binding flagellar brake protein YcgR